MMDEEEVALDMPPIGNEEDFDTRLRRLSHLKGVVEDAEETLKALKAEYDGLSYALAQYMMASGCLSKVLDGISYKQTQRVFSKVEDKEALRNWISKNDAVDLLMAVHPSKLTAYCNEQLEAGGSTPDGVNPSFIKYSVKVK
jgi:hypothetical protein